LLFGYLIRQSSHQLVYKIDKHIYQDKDLVEIKIPLRVPYFSSWSDYEPFEGEITINNSHHNYVKRKIARDTLFLLCLPNTEKDNLVAAKTNYDNIVNDFDGERKDENAVKKANDFPQYQFHHPDYSLNPPQISITNGTGFVSLFIPDSFISRHDIPPEFNS